MNQTAATSRDASVVFVIGAKRTGKTYFSENFVKEALKKKARALIIQADDCDWQSYKILKENEIQTFTGARRIIFDEQTTLNLLQDYRNGLLVLDDCRMYLEATTTKLLRGIIGRPRQRGLNVLVIAHGFSEIPPRFFTFCTDIVLFKTRDNLKLIKKYLLNYELIAEIQERVNDKANSQLYYKEIFEY